MSENYFVVDVDTGGDDAWALLYLFKAEQEGKLKVLGVTCCGTGNTPLDNVVQNTLLTLSASGNCDVPVYRGTTSPIVNEVRNEEIPWFGENGFGDINLRDPIEEEGWVQQRKAANAMYKFASEYPNQVSFILIGPLTNFALCLDLYDDFAEKVKDVYVMGGNTRAIGNITASAEYNFFRDSEAAAVVLHKLKKSIKILGWEVTMPGKVDIPLEWRFDVMGSVDSPVLELMNPVEKAIYEHNEGTDWIPSDAILVACILFPDEMILKESEWHADVELTGTYTRGMMVLDHLKLPENDLNICTIDKIDVEFFKKVSLWAVGHPDSEIEF